MNTSEFFQSAGYLRVPAVFTPTACADLRDVALRVAKRSTDGRVLISPERTRIDHVVSVDPMFLGIAIDERLVEALRPLLGPDIELIEDRHNHLCTYHMANTNPAHRTCRMHRDVLQWSRTILTALVYLSDCTDLSAATRVVPGSHLLPCAGRVNNGGTWLDESPYDVSDQAVPVPAEEGDVVLMHGQLYHAGGGASAAGPRTVLTLAYRSVDELAEAPPLRCRLVSGQRIYRGRGVVHA